MCPASPRSPKSDTGKAGEPLEHLLAGVEKAGYALDLREVVSAGGGVNPTRIDLRSGPHHTWLLVYSWYMTLEGLGRQNDNFRIQTTRAHEGPLMSEPGRITVGLGWRRTDDVFVAFDAWAKRYTGGSSSVHINRSLVDAVAVNGSANAGTRYDVRFGFDPAHAGSFVTWAHGLGSQKVAALAPHSWQRVDKNTAVVVGKVHARQPTSALREGDQILIVDARKRVADPSIWQIESLAPQEEQTAMGRPRRFIRFDCWRLGKVDDLDDATISALL